MNGGPRTLLGFDYGLKRIGIAVGQELTGTASPLETLTASANGIDWGAIQHLIAEWKPHALVVGLPLNMDGTEHEMTTAARQFAARLRNKYGLPVYEVDERLSSIAAEERLQADPAKRSQRKDRRDRIDREAAQIILQTWLNEQ